MISAVPKAFDGYSAEFYYIPFPKNVILKIGDETYNKIHYRMTIKEYFECNNMEFKDSKAFIKTEDYTKCVFEKFIDTESDFYDVIERIRVGYREKRINVKEIETRENTEKKPQISNLSKFIKEISFPQSESGFLTKDETVYLTGGWFEEYIFSLIKKSINPQDIALGVPLPISENRRVNKRDLDVVFTYENKLFVIECKTGINKESILSETVYKAAALKNERLGRLSAHTSIFSLSGENEEFRDIARAMNIFYYDRTFFVNEEKFESILSDINSKAKG
jgi:hypothetical protein